MGALIFFWQPISSGFDRVSGDQGDARLVVALHEHWLQVLRGRASWRSPGFFHPVHNVLGYSDTFLLNLPLYGPLRLLGLDRWLAFQGTLMLLSCIGLTASYWVLRRILRLDRFTSCALAAAFAFANNLAVAAYHAQLAAVHWLPVAMLLGWKGVRSTTLRRRVTYGAASGSLLGLVLCSAYYIGWFALLTAAIFVVVLLLLRTMDRALAELIEVVRGQVVVLLAGSAGFLLALVPFALIYLPVLGTTASRRYSEVMTLAPRPLDIVNLGAGNHLWASMMQRLLGDQPARLANGEVSLAVSPILTGLVLGTGLLVLVRRRRGDRTLRTTASLAAVITVAVLTVLPVNWGGWSLWVVPWTIVPGAVGIRAADRIQLVTSLLSCLVVGAGILTLRDALPAGGRGRRRMAIVLPVALLAVLGEQHSVSDVAHLSRTHELALARRTPVAPASCRSFFMVPLDGRPSFAVETDAMLIAVDTGLPTLNGYSGTVPRGYHLDPDHSDYLERVAAWARDRGVLAGLCSFDRSSHAWSTHPLEGIELHHP